ncbi:hypothetical protein F4777DRAFT_553466 [Nemania sp. FL0916]|nr:hypothetical protein F4777DRAFT_553466 [Nemania sp. FL0916]
MAFNLSRGHQWFQGKYPNHPSLQNTLETTNLQRSGLHSERYLNTILKGQVHQYRIQRCLRDEGDLRILSVIRDHDKQPCEAQLFQKCQLPEKLYLSRKRRIQRLKRSSNFMDYMDQDNHRVLVTRVSEDKLLEKDSVMSNEDSTAHYSFCPDEFPPLGLTGPNNNPVLREATSRAIPEP